MSEVFATLHDHPSCPSATRRATVERGTPGCSDTGIHLTSARRLRPNGHRHLGRLFLQADRERLMAPRREIADGEPSDGCAIEQNIDVRQSTVHHVAADLGTHANVRLQHISGPVAFLIQRRHQAGGIACRQRQNQDHRAGQILSSCFLRDVARTVRVARDCPFDRRISGMLISLRASSQKDGATKDGLRDARQHASDGPTHR